MSNLIGKRAKLIDISGLSCGISLAKQLLSATGVIKSVVENSVGILCHFTLDEPWKSLHQEDCCTFSYRFEIIEDEATEPKEFDNFMLLDISAELQNLSRECIQMFKDKEMS